MARSRLEASFRPPCSDQMVLRRCDQSRIQPSQPPHTARPMTAKSAAARDAPTTKCPGGRCRFPLVWIGIELCRPDAQQSPRPSDRLGTGHHQRCLVVVRIRERTIACCSALSSGPGSLTRPSMPPKGHPHHPRAGKACSPRRRTFDLINNFGTRPNSPACAAAPADRFADASDDARMATTSTPTRPSSRAERLVGVEWVRSTVEGHPGRVGRPVAPPNRLVRRPEPASQEQPGEAEKQWRHRHEHDE